MGFLSGLGNMSALSRVASDPRTLEAVQSAGKGGRRGLLGGLPHNRRGFDWGAAALSFFGGPQVANAMIRRRHDQAEAEQEAQQHEEAVAALGQITDQQGRPRFTKAQLRGMRLEDLSRVAAEFASPRQFGAEGGSLYNPGNGEFTNAPRSYTDEGRVFNIDPQGNPTQVLDARQNDVRWQTGPWGAFATDRSGRPVAPGTNIQSPMGGGQPPAQGQAPAAPPPTASPTSAVDPEAIFGRMIGAESRGQQFAADGRPLTSRRGAIGIAQVMPGTAPEAAQMAGLPFDQQRYHTDPQYNAALGRAYFQHQLSEFSDPAMAVAAYNAGPQRVRSAIQRGGANWQAHIPAETRDYIQNVLGETAGGTQFAQAGGMPGQGRSVQDQAATGSVRAEQQPPPGYRWGSNGSLQAIPGGPGEQANRNNANQDRTFQNTVLQNFNQDPEVRQFRQARIATQQIRALGQSGRPSDDLAIIFSFMRALDPTSTVREGEFATAQNTAGWSDRVRNYYNQARAGNRLNDTQRRDMMATGFRLYRERARSYNEVANNYRDQLREAGVPENRLGRLVQTAEEPMRYDREQARGRQQQPTAQQNVDAMRGAVNAMLPGRRRGRTSHGVQWSIVE